jgi:hypothetical protein
MFAAMQGSTVVDIRILRRSCRVGWDFVVVAGVFVGGTQAVFSGSGGCSIGQTIGLATATPCGPNAPASAD